MKCGYLLQAWLEEGVSIPVVVNFETHMHLLLTGSSGSGKSYALIYLLGSLARETIKKLEKKREDKKRLEAKEAKKAEQKRLEERIETKREMAEELMERFMSTGGQFDAMA